MTDYNDGNWHGWNGGDCPVHPQSVVDYVWHDTRCGQVGIWHNQPASSALWGSRVIRFRVITPYVEPPKPREIWINEYPSGQIHAHFDEVTARKWYNATPDGKTTRWIEVLE